MFLDILDTTIVNVAIPALGRELHTENAEWVVLGYTLSLAVWIPTSGWLGDRFGTKRTFLFALMAFTGGSLLCGTAQTIGQLIAFRVIQGVGGGMLTPVGLAMLFRAFPPAERARASTLIMIPTLAAPALGPVLGGLIVTNVSWRWIFLVNVPDRHRRVVVRLAPPAGVPPAGERPLRHRRVHPLRYGVGVDRLHAQRGAACPDGRRRSWSPAGRLGVLAAIAMTIVELRIPFPMLDLKLLRNRMFRQCNLVSLFSIGSFLGVTFVMPLYLQLLRGMTPLASGLTTFPQAFGVMVSSVIAGQALRAHRTAPVDDAAGFSPPRWRSRMYTMLEHATPRCG